jgi:hypothetical protein
MCCENPPQPPESDQGNNRIDLVCQTPFLIEGISVPQKGMLSYILCLREDVLSIDCKDSHNGNAAPRPAMPGIVVHRAESGP